MWGAIIQAIDHAMGRMHDGAGAGIKVADSQHGGSAQTDTSMAGEAIKENNQEIISNKGKEDEASTGGLGGAIGGGAAEGASEGAAGGAGAEGIAEAAGSILSDEKAKDAAKANSAAKNTVSGWQKARAYGENASKGFANAGSIATGQGKAFEYSDNWLTDGAKKGLKKETK